MLFRITSGFCVRELLLHCRDPRAAAPFLDLHYPSLWCRLAPRRKLLVLTPITLDAQEQPQHHLSSSTQPRRAPTGFTLYCARVAVPEYSIGAGGLIFQPWILFWQIPGGKVTVPRLTHDARPATDADPASGPGIDDTATSRSIQSYHDLPRAVAGVEAPADSFSAIGCVQPQHSARTIAPRGYTDRGGKPEYPCGRPRWDG